MIGAAITTVVGVAFSLAVTVVPASAAGGVTITVGTSPAEIATGQALAYTITVTNASATDATALSISDTFAGITEGAAFPSFYMTASDGSCVDNTGSVTCTAASLPANSTWTVTVTGQVSLPAGSVITDTATVTGTQGSGSFNASGGTTTTVAPSLPSGFQQTQLASGLKKPIAIAFAPNGDIYIAGQAGTIVVYRNGVILPTPLVTLPNVWSQGESGLTGMALDPNYATNGYIYLSYTLATTKNGVVQPFSQLSRFTVVNGSIDLSSEKVYLRGNQVQNVHHAGNDLKVGPDGKLWWAVGDNVPAITNARTLTNIYGKILRFNLDGTVPSDNPFLNVPNAVPAIYAYGLRNPWRFTFLPNGKAMTEDTGSSFWEELDTIEAGGNYGWDLVEGNAFGSGAIDPTYAYGHMPEDGAASAIAAYSGTTFPAAYAHTVFVGDYGRSTIEAVNFDATYKTEVSHSVFDTNVGSIADLLEGPDGNLYYVSIFQSSLTRISAPGPFPPTATATATPNAGLAPLNVQFSSAGSTDPFNKPLTYSWDFGDGTQISTVANPSHQYVSNGTFIARLTVSDGAQSDTTTARVVVGNTPPVATVNAPSTYNAGDIVNFAGSATDAVDGPEPAYAYTWKVDFYDNGVAHPIEPAEVAFPFYGPVSGQTSGSITIPTDPSQTPTSFYRITLQVTDSLGLTSIVSRDVHPNVATVSSNANVGGAGYAQDGTWRTAGASETSVVGVRHVLTGMALSQSLSGTRYRFNSWADGSALDDNVVVGAAGNNATANYEPVTSTLPAGWQSADVGSPLMAGGADYSAGSGTFYIDGTGADVYGNNDQFHYVYQTLAGDGTIVARVRYQTNSSAWAKAGVMIKQSATGGAAFVDALVSPDVSAATPNSNGVGCTPDGCAAPLPPVQPAMGHGVRMQYTSTGSITPGGYPAGFASPNKWLKLQKAGNAFTSWMSADGQTWTKIGSVTQTMAGPVTIGLFDTSHNIGQFSTAAFDNVQVTPAGSSGGALPAPWTDSDVGSPSPAGSAQYNNGTFAVDGSGADIWGTSDQFNYVNQPATTSGTITARVTSQTNTSSNAKAGLMFKQSTAAGSPYFMISTGPTGAIKAQYNFNTSVGGGTYAFPNVWMKLSWSAGVFTAYVSADGTNWTTVLSKALAITSPATVGLFECSHKAGALGTATFDNVSYVSP